MRSVNVTYKIYEFSELLEDAKTKVKNGIWIISIKMKNFQIYAKKNYLIAFLKAI